MSATEGRLLRFEPVARACFAVLGLLAMVGVALSLCNGLVLDSPVDHASGHHRAFSPGWENLVNQPLYFTFMSNFLVGVTSLVLAVRPRLRAGWFHIVHLAGLVCIVITGVVFNLLLRGDDAMTRLQFVHDTVQHVVTPIVAPLLWLVFGPLGQVTWRRIGWSMVIPIAWLVVTLVRGALLNWYPYSILDVPALGYGGVSVYVVAILVFYGLVTAVMRLIDRHRRPVWG